MFKPKFAPLLLELKNLEYFIAANCIIERMNLRLHAGKILVLLGPSGCGKSTLLHLIAGLIEPSGGQILRYAKQLSYVFQEANLLPFYTALQNICLAANCAEQDALKFLERIGLNQADANKYPSELSGGMKARINYARAILAQHQILLLDEPFSSINHELKSLLIGHLKEHIKAQNKAAILITHSRDEAIKLADEIYLCQEFCRVKKHLAVNSQSANSIKEELGIFYD